MRYYTKVEDDKTVIGFIDEETGDAVDEVATWKVVATYLPAKLVADDEVPLRDQDLIAFAKGVAAELLSMDAVARPEFLAEYALMLSSRKARGLGSFAPTRLQGALSL